ncbi:hypothetical protein GCM10022420_027730 [Streptomyces iranensis]
MASSASSVSRSAKCLYGAATLTPARRPASARVKQCAQEVWYGDAFGLTQVEERLELPEAGVRTAVLSDAAGLRVEFVERPGSSPVAHPASPKVCVTRTSPIRKAIFWS